MKKAKQTLTAALAATLATGVVGSVASAATNDELYAAAYKAMVKAQTEKTQAAINEARTAINAMPKELDWAKGEFSKQVDPVQHPIFVKIVDVASKADKNEAATQKEINEARALVKELPATDEANKSTWSSKLDTLQTVLVKNATDAITAAAKSQKAEDITKAEALIEDLKTADNADVKKAVEGLEKDLAEKVNIYVKDVKVENGTTINVTFSKEVRESSVSKENFVVEKGNLKYYAKDAELQDDKKTVKVTLANVLEDAKEYNLVSRNIVDAKGVILKETKTAIKYEKTEVANIKFVTTNTVKGADLRDQLEITNANGVNITEELKLKKLIKIESVTDKNAIKDGVVQSVARLKKEYTVKVTVGDKFLEEKITVVESLASEIVDYTLANEAISAKSYKDKKVTINHNLRSVNSSTGDVKILTVFYKDALGEIKAASGKDITKISSSDVKVVKPTVDNKLQALKVGTALITVKIGTMEETVEVQVTKDVVADAKIDIKNPNITVAKSSVKNYIPVDLVDSYTGKAAKKEAFTVEFWNESSEKWESTSKVTATDGEICVVGNRLDSSKRARLVKNYRGLKLEQEFDIIVQDAGAVSGIIIEATDSNRAVSTIDKNDTDYPQSAEIEVYGVDDNGNKVDLKNVANIKILEGSEDTAVNRVKLVAASDATYTFDAKVNHVGTYDFTAEATIKGEKVTSQNSVAVSVTDGEVATTVEDYYTTTAGTFTINDKVQVNYEGTTTSAAIYAVNTKGVRVVTLNKADGDVQRVTLKYATLADGTVVELNDTEITVEFN